MFNCADDVLAYHDDETTLSQSDRSDMRDRRNANRTRLKNGLQKAGDPKPSEFASQGSYAMKTMTQHPDNNYDIDDGVYFEKAALVGDRGAEMTALQARQMVRDAVDDGSFATKPEALKNCVRVFYEAGYHVDIPVYRRVLTKNYFGVETEHFEIASSDWKRSDARDVTEWFENENKRQSQDTENGRQLRRIVRLLKKFARSRSSWEDQILSGFGITKLVTECLHADKTREDRSLYQTMSKIYYRLVTNLVINHPTTPGETITKGSGDSKARFFKEKLKEALDNLQPLFNSDCKRKDALKCWDKVFSTDFFSQRVDKTAKASASLLGSATSAPAAFSFQNALRSDAKPRGFA
jgi:hypothetical protein